MTLDAKYMESLTKLATKPTDTDLLEQGATTPDYIKDFPDWANAENYTPQRTSRYRPVRVD